MVEGYLFFSDDTDHDVPNSDIDKVVRTVYADRVFKPGEIFYKDVETYDITPIENREKPLSIRVVDIGV